MPEPLYSQPPEKKLNAPRAKAPDFRTYVDPTGEFSSKELGHAMWFVRHEVGLYRWLVRGLVAIASVLWIYSLAWWGSYLLFGLNRDRLLSQQATQFPNYTVWQEHLSPAPLQVVDTVLLAGGVNKSDAVAEIANPNDRWLARFNYRFSVNGEQTKLQDTFLLPGESRPVAMFGLPASGNGVTISLENVRWQRINPHQVTIPKDWQAERLQFRVADFVFRRAGSDPDAPLAQVIQFNLSNASPYGYKTPSFLIGAYSGTALTAVFPLTLEDFASLETKPVDVRSFANSLTADSVQVFPLINPYNTAVYLPPPQ